MDLISSPEKLATELWAGGFLSSEIWSEIITSQSSSYLKKSKILYEVHMYFANCTCETRFEEFLKILKDNSNPAINFINFLQVWQ